MITLTGDHGSQAQILPELGLNCFSLTLVNQLGSHEVIWAPDGFAAADLRPSSGGIPLLFPFPGRIRKGSYQWNGRAYQLPANDRLGNAIHGFVYDRPWEVVDQTTNSLRARFQAGKQDAALLELWPADFCIMAEFQFSAADCFEMNFEISNPGTAPLPYGFGLHPYFAIPFDQTAPAEHIVKLPVSEQWNLENLVPDGNRSLSPQAVAYQAGQRLADLQLDNVFTIDRSANQTGVDAGEILSESQSVRYEFSGFDYCVAFTPPSRAAVCIEPYTSTPNFFELSEKSIECGLKILEPGAVKSYQTRVRLIQRK
jgi:aldose 1-epimerase